MDQFRDAINSTFQEMGFSLVDLTQIVGNDGYVVPRDFEVDPGDPNSLLRRRRQLYLLKKELQYDVREGKEKKDTNEADGRIVYLRRSASDNEVYNSNALEESNNDDDKGLRPYDLIWIGGSDRSIGGIFIYYKFRGLAGYLKLWGDVQLSEPVHYWKLAGMLPMLRCFGAINNDDTFHFLDDRIPRIRGPRRNNPAFEQNPLFDCLNDDQRLAAEDFFHRQEDMHMWMAPAGTGKTTTIVQALRALVNLGKKVLVTAPSNKAVLVILEKYYDKYGYGDSMKPKFWGREEKIQELCPDLLGKDLVINKRNITGDVNIVFSTLSSSYTLRMMFFPDTVVVDEAGQSKVSETMIPLTLAPKSLLLVGDPKQLPPTISDDSLIEDGGEKSLLSYLIEERGAEMHFFHEGYRMDPEINRWPSRYVYNEGLYANFTPSVISAHASQALLHRLPPYMHFSYGSGRGQEMMRNHAIENKTEALLIVKFIQLLIGDEEVHEDYGIVILTPYRGQVAMIENHIKKRMRKSIKYIGTVDGYQGSENDVIIISMVRSNDSGNLGFCNDLRRINVALTRAKKGCFVFGHHRTLTKRDHFRRRGQTNHVKRMIEDAEQRGLVRHLEYDNYDNANTDWLQANADDISFLVRFKDFLERAERNSSNLEAIRARLFYHYRNLVLNGGKLNPVVDDADEFDFDLTANVSDSREWLAGIGRSDITASSERHQELVAELNQQVARWIFQFYGGIKKLLVAETDELPNEELRGLSSQEKRKINFLRPDLSTNEVEHVKKVVQYAFTPFTNDDLPGPYNPEVAPFIEGKNWLRAIEALKAWASCNWWKAKVLYDKMWSGIKGTNISSKMSKMWVATYSAWVYVHFGKEFIGHALDRLRDAINCCPMTKNKTLFEHLSVRLSNEKQKSKLTALIYKTWSQNNVNDEIACRLLATYAALLARSADYDTNTIGKNLFLGIHDLLPRIFSIIRQKQGTGHEGTGDNIQWIDEICKQHGRGYGLGYPARIVWDANGKATSFSDSIGLDRVLIELLQPRDANRQNAVLQDEYLPLKRDLERKGCNNFGELRKHFDIDTNQYQFKDLLRQSGITDEQAIRFRWTMVNGSPDQKKT
jgi:hypothetical protein